ncbi:ATP-binding protein [Pectobacterium aroidearum]|uniref:ATP-binding protein n=1 Tax=Pectobacterium aroidearum TaxID=1201031 RepID=A0AAW3STK7_9GAMM|nr:ATP-binding protein [Pectobacterium aroidearum]MBA5203924.1 ATP-binding protein [Pectobacterium aroidearum]
MSLNHAHEGYDYQDLLTSYFILKEVLDGNWNSVFSIDKKNTSDDVPDRFDDLVIVNGSKIQRKQIKYSNDVTSKILEKSDLANDNGYGLAIYKLFETWRNLRAAETEFRLCLAWDEPISVDITRILTLQNDNSSFESFSTTVFKINLDKLWETNPENFNRWDSFKKYVKESNLNRGVFDEFCNELLIEVNLPKASLNFDRPGDLERILIEQAERIGIGQYPNDDVYTNDFLVRLAKLVGAYRSGTRDVAVRYIFNELRVKTNFGKIEQKFEVNTTKNIVFEQANNDLLIKIIKNKKSILLGEPGSGKSWFLTNFIKYLEENNINVIRHYCFTSTDDDFSEKRVLSDVFFGNLIANVIELFPKLQAKKSKLLASSLDELNLLLSNIEETLVIIIDGLDHIERVIKSSTLLSQNKTRIIDFISKIQNHPNVTILIGSQPVNEIILLIDNHDFQRIDLPKWNVATIKSLMTKYDVDDIKTNNGCLSSSIYQKSQGNPLYATYILKIINGQQKSPEEIISKLPSYDHNLESYYNYLSSQLESNLTSDILGCLDFSITKSELAGIMIYSHYLEKDLEILSPVISTNSSRGGIRLYHDSFRRYIIERLSFLDQKNINYQIGVWLKKQGFYQNAKSYRYLLSYLIKSEDYDEALKFADNNFLKNSLYQGHSELAIKNNYNGFLHIASTLQKWDLFVYLSELNRTIAATNSEDSYSQFLQNFEVYFEAICLIHGTEKANSLLFFDGEKNFSDTTIAKAFIILQRNGYPPRWDEVEALFQDEIKLEHMKYYVYSRILRSTELESMFISLVEYENNDFFDEFILSLIENGMIDTILTLLNEVKYNTKIVAERINYIFEVCGVSQRINITENVAIEIRELQPLTINFVDDYIDSGKLSDFYDTVSQYAIKDINGLMIFERSISKSNFFYNWMRFFIRDFIIEYTVPDEKKEKESVENIIFLSSDVEKYKGNPRAIDFTYSNADLVKHTIKKSLKYIKSKSSWESVIKHLITIPFPALAIVENHFITDDNIEYIINAYDEFEGADYLDYSEHADYCFKKSILQAKSKKLDAAQEELKKAIEYITTYTFRKDTTLSELIYPLSSINRMDIGVAKEYAKKLKYLSDAVMKHTEDGKGIRWLAIDWFNELLNIDCLLAKKYLVHELINDPYFWKLDYMLINLLVKDNVVNPVLSAFLYRLSPTNNRVEYLNGFLDTIVSLEHIDKDLAKLFIINLSSRDLNDSDNKADSKTLIRFGNVMRGFDLIPFSHVSKSQDNLIFKSSTANNLSKILSEKLCINDSVIGLSMTELCGFYIKKDCLSDGDLNAIYFYLCGLDGVQWINELLVPMIRKQFPGDTKTRYEDFYNLIIHLVLDADTQIHLLVNNFLYSKDGWLAMFTHKESLKKAVEIDKEKTLEFLAKELANIFSNIGYMSNSTANLIIAFEHSGMDKNIVLDMYNRGFEFIENRLPDNNDFRWDDVEDYLMSEMDHDELALVLMLAKTKHNDTEIQREVLFAISYLLNYDERLLIKPLKWFVKNIDKFNELTIASLLEILLIEMNRSSTLLLSIQDELKEALRMDNLYIKNLLNELVKEASHE